MDALPAGRQAALHCFLSSDEIDHLIREDVPYFDLTTFALNIGDRPGRIEFATRHTTVICGIEEACCVLEKCGATIDAALSSGPELPADTVFLSATGPAQALHRAWKVSVNLLEYVSGIATRTHELVEAAHEVNRAAEVVTTRKMFPGTRPLAIKGVLAGGAIPHRLGLSETVLIFEQHMAFLGGLDGLLAVLEQARQTSQEKKICVEVGTPDAAHRVAQAGAHVIQFDKVPVSELMAAVPELRNAYPHIKLAAAGGIDMHNIHAYAATGVDMLVTTAPYFGKPADIKARMAAT
jgi:molybdenum transport protein